jgi:acyl carrier protein
MDDTQLRSRLTGIFRDAFDDPALEINDAMTAHDVEAWDSLTHINLIVAVEKEFKIKFTTGEVNQLRKVGDLVALIQRKAA